MELLIDGYNLLWAGNIVGPQGPGTSLQRSRRALLELLCRWIPAERRARTLIVFDATNAPPGLPKRGTWEQIEIEFAERREEADDVLIRLIEASTDPRRLVVVSSDHRIQRAARRRGARAVDSEEWLREVRRAVRQSAVRHDISKPADARDGDTDYWLGFFQVEPGELIDAAPIENVAREMRPEPGGQAECTEEEGIFPPEFLQQAEALLEEGEDDGPPNE